MVKIGVAITKRAVDAPPPPDLHRARARHPSAPHRTTTDAAPRPGPPPRTAQKRSDHTRNHQYGCTADEFFRIEIQVSRGSAARVYSPAGYKSQPDATPPSQSSSPSPRPPPPVESHAPHTLAQSNSRCSPTTSIRARSNSRSAGPPAVRDIPR